MNAILKYAGGKWRIAPWIISHFPPHKVYCEPFFGSGAVFFTKSACRIETVNDIDGNIVNLFRVCREAPEDLARAKLRNLEEQGMITEEERRGMQAGNGGKLNPTWVEWLMGFPLGWTDLEGSEMQ